MENKLTKDAKVKIFNQLSGCDEELTRNNIEDASKYQRLKQLCSELTNVYTTESFKCPTIRFGRTELAIPIITCGGMRMQQTWKPTPEMTLTDIKNECQENFEQIIKRALELGINHFETARGYGTSEMQYGILLKKYPRHSYILQSKVRPMDSAQDFRNTLHKTFQELQIDEEGGYLDLFSFHGVNRPEDLDRIQRPGGCMEVVNEYRKLGKIRWVGFSTHGMTPLIIQTIETNLFDYLNLHYQFIGSYTASGTGPTGSNLAAIHIAKKHDMGVFIISPNDKGGCLYQPSKIMYRECLPLTPITFNYLWLWSQDPFIHTLSLGAARPTDFDEVIQAAMLYPQRKELVASIEKRLLNRVDKLFGKDFRNQWFQDLPDAYSNEEGVPVNELYWFWWIIQAWGLHEFVVRRYASLDDCPHGWDDSKPLEENIKAFSWCPGMRFHPDRQQQLRDVLYKAKLDNKRVEHVLDAITQLHEWVRDGGCFKRGEPPISIDEKDYEGWKMAYNLQPDIPFPERL